MNTETLQHIQENIALLSLLNREPGTPSTAKLGDYASRGTPQDTHSRCLPLNREYEIAECLAFLSGTTDNPKKVTALSIEENAGGSSLTIRIATNSGVDDKLLHQFQTMARTLQKASNCAHPEERQKIIGQAVLTLDRERLLSRLRSRHAEPSLRNRGKPTITSRLAKQDVSLVFIGSECSSSFQSFQQRTKILETLFAQLESFATADVRDGEADAVLLDLMQEFNSLPSQHVLQEAFRCIGDSGACAPDAASLVIAVAKIRRYWATCEFLSTAVRRYSVFRDVRIARVMTELPFVPTASLPAKGYFQKALLRLNQRDIWKGSAEQFCHQRLNCSLPVVGKRFLAYMNNLRPGVHAEIQLLMFYETHPNIQWPRVIASSKSACFLCNLLLLQHGRFYVGKTHGVLYPNWTMPVACLTRFSGSQMQRINQVIKSFAFEVEKALLTTIQLKSKRSHPNESVADFPMCWTPSLVCSSHSPPSIGIAELSAENSKTKPQKVIPKEEFTHHDQAASTQSSVFQEQKKQPDEETVTTVSDHVILEFFSDAELNKVQYDVSHPSTPLEYPRSCQILVDCSTKPIYLHPGVPISVQFRAPYNILVIAGGLILELSDKNSIDSRDRCSETSTISCVLTTSGNSYVPGEHLIDLEAMEAGETRGIELKEELDSSSLFLGRSMFLKHGKSIVALLLHE